MKVLFLDQSGKLGGAELSLLDVVKPYRDCCLVLLFSDGCFRMALEQYQIPVQVLSSKPIAARKDSGFFQGLVSLLSLLRLTIQVAKTAALYDVLYANTPKALIVGAFASLLSSRPLIYHLRDIFGPEHFSRINRCIAVTLANRCASLVIANSNATRSAFIKAGGRPDTIDVIYNGFDPKLYLCYQSHRVQMRQVLGMDGNFVIGHFSRLSPWKGQHVLLEALAKCPNEITAIFVGDALFGEQDYVQQLQQMVGNLGLCDRVQFLGFRSDVPTLMGACNLVAHTSTAPEPFGRVIVEAMLCGCPVVAAAAGGAIEILEHGQTGWLVPPQDSGRLADIINQCYHYPDQADTIARRGQVEAAQRFHISQMNQQIAQCLHQVVKVR